MFTQGLLRAGGRPDTWSERFQLAFETNRPRVGALDEAYIEEAGCGWVSHFCTQTIDYDTIILIQKLSNKGKSKIQGFQTFIAELQRTSRFMGKPRLHSHHWSGPHNPPILHSPHSSTCFCGPGLLIESTVFLFIIHADEFLTAAGWEGDT